MTDVRTLESLIKRLQDEVKDRTAMLCGVKWGMSNAEWERENNTLTTLERDIKMYQELLAAAETEQATAAGAELRPTAVELRPTAAELNACDMSPENVHSLFLEEAMKSVDNSPLSVDIDVRTRWNRLFFADVIVIVIETCDENFETIAKHSFYL